jgi:predicted Rossmann fold flavoprotein
VSSHFDIIIIGAGAAGLMCAIEAGKRGRKVLVIEHNDRVGRKIAISGGGRCNFTNLETPAKSYLSENPHFAKSALSRYTPNDFIKLIEKHGIAYHEKTLGQLFCDDSSRQVIDMLISECKEANVEIKTSTLVLKVSKDDTFSLLTTSGVMTCDSLVIATGGLSIPNIGATNFGYRIAEQFGLKVNELRPALVPLLWNDEDRNIFGEISGVSIDAKVTVGKVSFRENLLFTHRGVSGPVILQISSYWKDGDSIFIDLLPDTDTTDFFEEHRQAKQELTTVLSLLLPKRFVQVWCEKYFPSKPMNQMSTKALTELESKLHGWEIRPVATEGFEKAEVTAGGVDTNELSSKTMEARNVAGLYFIGEVVDVTGWLGGYNFQWAWSSGWAAGQVC